VTASRSGSRDDPKKLPQVSVVMAVRNGERYVRSALDSVLSQSFEDFEFIVVDDASIDGTRRILESCADPRLQVVCNGEWRGLPASLNRAIAAARGEFVARMDADDVCHPKRLELQVDFLRHHPGVSLVGTGARAVDSHGRVLSVNHPATTHEAIRWHLLFHTQFYHPTVMWRRSVLSDAVGSYDEAFSHAEDYEYFSRVALRCRTANLPSPLLDYRRHDGARGATSLTASEAAAALVSERELRRLFNGDLPVPASWLRAVGHYGADVLPPLALRPAAYGFLATRRAFMRQAGLRCVPGTAARREIDRHVRSSLADVVVSAAKSRVDTAATALLIGAGCPMALMLAFKRALSAVARWARARPGWTMCGSCDTLAERRRKMGP
jgi:Glycosyl transferase family 2